MILDRSRRLLFVKTRKTAGTSIEVALSQVLGPDAVVSPLRPAEPGHQPRNHLGLWNPVPEVVRGHRGVRQTVHELRARRRAWNHAPYVLIADRFGRRDVERCFSFCVERDPWSKTVSFWRMRLRDQPGVHSEDFDEFVHAPGQVLPSDWHLYTRGGRVAVDRVVRYDRLAVDLPQVLASAGVALPTPLPTAKAAAPARAPDLAADTVALIGRVFAREIAEFGFTYRRGAATPAP